MLWRNAPAQKSAPADETTVADRMADAYDASSRGDYARALEIWGPLAQAGVPRAQNNIGACFSQGLGVERDLKLAVQWLSLAAAGGAGAGFAGSTDGAPARAPDLRFDQRDRNGSSAISPAPAGGLPCP